MSSTRRRDGRPDEYIYDLSFPEEAGDPGPHLWTNPPYALRYAEIVGEQLSTLDPGHAADYEANLAAFEKRIDALDMARARGHGRGPRGEPQAPHLPRFVPVLRA